MTPKSPTDAGLLFFFIKRHLPMGVGKINSFFEFLFTFLDIAYLFLQIFFWILSWQCILNVQELFLFLFPFFLVSCSYFRVQDLFEYLWEYKFCFSRLDISSWLRKIFLFIYFTYISFLFWRLSWTIWWGLVIYSSLGKEMRTLIWAVYHLSVNFLHG